MFKQKEIPLIQAITDHDNAKVASLLENGSSPNDLSRLKVMHHDERMTALMMAAKARNLDAMRLLVEHGADIETRNADGDTALLLTTAYAFREGFFFLLKNKADLHAINDYGWNGFHRALIYNQTDIIDALIDNGVNLNQRNNLDMSPLDYADDDNIESAKRLIAAGANLDIQEKRTGLTVLMKAAMRDYLLLYKALVNRGADTALADHEGFTAQRWAEEMNSKHVLDFIETSEARPR